MSDNKAKAVPATNDTASFGPAAGPLVVSQTNPRYFTVAAGDVAHRRVVYLTGSHVNNNFHDGSGPGADCSETPEPNDFSAYLGFLKERATTLSGCGAGSSSARRSPVGPSTCA